VELYEQGKRAMQRLLQTAPGHSSSSPFVTDLTTALVSANIPFAKIENKEFSNFLEKYTKQGVPSRRTLTSTMEETSKAVFLKIRYEFELTLDPFIIPFLTNAGQIW